MAPKTNVDDVPNYKSFYLRNYAAQEGHSTITSILDYFMFLKRNWNYEIMSVYVPYSLWSYLIGFHEI
jgi:hypothetical protein